AGRRRFRHHGRRDTALTARRCESARQPKGEAVIVTVDTVARIVSHNGVAKGGVPVQLTMRYYVRDPFAAQFAFGDGEGPVWHFARDLLADGVRSREPVGDADVQVWRGLSPGLVWLRLSGRDG